MLELAAVSCHYDGVQAVERLDLTLAQGQVLGLVGPNGSGKTSTLNLISGLVPLKAGRISLAGQDIGRMPMHSRLACGLARTFQTARLFGRLTVEQNVAVALKMVPALGAGAIGEALAFAGLTARRGELAAHLDREGQRRLELARALACRPRMLLLDEPGASMNAGELAQLRRRILCLRDRGMTILLVEHVMELLEAVADRIVVLHAGRKIADGAGRAVWAMPAVRAAYLGAGPP
ncbi:ABC transporter ATP-binding protein [Oxalobacteraceae bacterium]|nr:ABC transporter ATP-binding protein [Oxalobacteraceae bacterium]